MRQRLTRGRIMPGPMSRRLRTAALTTLSGLLLAGSIAGCKSFDEKQSEWIFNPRKESWAGGLSSAGGMHEQWIEYQSAITDRPVRLHALWDPNPSPSAPVMLYLHGARWDVTGSAGRVRRMRDLGFSVLVIDYRGFGQSSAGPPTEKQAYEDARAAWNWHDARHPEARRYIFGHSLGGAIAVQLSTQVDNADGLIVEGAFPSVAAVFETMKWGWMPITWLITQRFDSAARIADVKVPVLVVHGSDDALIPPELGRDLYERATAPKQFVLVQGGSHHNTNAVGQQQYRQAISQLFGLRGAATSITSTDRSSAVPGAKVSPNGY